MDIFDINNGQKIKELKQFMEILDAIVSNHEQQIKDLAAQLLELKQSTAIFKPGMSVTQGDVTPKWESAVLWAEAKRREKNDG